ncbi:MAG TPA: hypothetical protein VIS10_09310 [Anaerolineales bacterium]
MKTALIISAILTGLLLFSTLICGFWLRYSGEEITKSSLDFHMMIALATTLATLTTVVLAVVRS